MLWHTHLAAKPVAALAGQPGATRGAGSSAARCSTNSSMAPVGRHAYEARTPRSPLLIAALGRGSDAATDDSAAIG